MYVFICIFMFEGTIHQIKFDEVFSKMEYSYIELLDLLFLTLWTSNFLCTVLSVVTALQWKMKSLKNCMAVLFAGDPSLDSAGVYYILRIIGSVRI